MFVATLVASAAIGQGDIADARDRLHDAGCRPGESRWIDPEVAADLFFDTDPATARAVLTGLGQGQGLGQGIDVIVQPVAHREKQLIVADMDSTMITVECIDELADYAGIKAEIAEITERAMQGELDFAAALRARVALLKDLDEAVIEQCRTERVRIMPGARALIRTMRARGAWAVLVSGGFTRFADPVAAEIGFDTAIANVLDIAGGKLTGTVHDPIVDAARKRFELGAAMARSGIAREATLAVGDGANDIPMIEAAGLGVAYHAKEKTRAAADAEIVHGDLRVLLYAQGIGRADWVPD
ncbi:phosphoserine phosphatase SerB [Sphingobium algorifonticola]|uniref:Phosphoserine phosphatase n=1 Tax=Sphingobium algorifonticola TaxID=2008318 RepID=A0A437J6H4_9SPHN|nr:phosphoserine phosphatase SerB [Sphingobium algorifonticola]RVT40783.1 phosphoserine phosphatase SerB [Sphingobium algorifonticola]